MNLPFVVVVVVFSKVSSLWLVCVGMSFCPNARFNSSVGTIPDEAKALSLLAPANAVAGILPGGGLLPTPNPMSTQGVRRSHRLALYRTETTARRHAPDYFKSLSFMGRLRRAT